MIFVTVGAAFPDWRFKRLVQKIDEIAPRFDEEFIVQAGSTSYEPENAEWFKFATVNDMVGYYERAKMVIGHCGSGTVLHALRLGVPIIVVPRDRSLGEVEGDDHQLELAKRLESYPSVKVIRNVDDLEAAVKEWLKNPPQVRKNSLSPSRESLIDGLKNYVSTVSNGLEGR